MTSERRMQIGWLIERNMTPEGQEYLWVGAPGEFGWTTDHEKALRLARKADAETICYIVEDAVRVAEHAWMPLPEPPEEP